MIASQSLLHDMRTRVLGSPRLDPLRQLKRRLMRRSEGEAFLLERYASHFDRPLDLDAPKTFTEKLFCRMVRWNRRMDSRFTDLADKLAVRSYVSAKLGDDYLTRLYWQGADPAKIPFDGLPSRYVLKTNHGSGQVIRVAGNVDRDDVVRRASSWLSANYYWRYREYQYFHIRPRAFAEEYLECADGSEAVVYRFWCFGGVPRLLNVGNFARSMTPFFDTEWNKLELATKPNAVQPLLEKPPHFDRLLRAAERLSEGIDFVRVDLYNVDGRIVFGELTFTPSAGVLNFRPLDWDRKLGEMWTLRA
jgi:hypothetical protein